MWTFITLSYLSFVLIVIFSACQGRGDLGQKFILDPKKNKPLNRMKNTQKSKFLKGYRASNHRDNDQKGLLFGAQSMQLQPPTRKTAFDNVRNKILEGKHLSLSHTDVDFLFPKDLCVSRYCGVAKEIFKQKRQIAHGKLTPQRIADTDVFSVFYDMIQNGKISEKNIKANHVFARYSAARNNLHHVVLKQGSAFVIADCHLSIAYAEFSQNNNVVALFLDDESAAKCQQIILKRKLTNIYLSMINVKQTPEKFVLSEFFPANVTFDSVIMKEFGKLSDGLLPHEIEQVVSKVLQRSNQTIISLDFQQEQEKLNFFKTAWPQPADFINSVCARLPDSNCSMDILKGYLSSWDPVTFNMRLSKNMSEEELSIAQLGDFGIPLHYLLAINMTKTSRDALFLHLIESQVNISMLHNLFVQGHQILEVQRETKVKKQENQFASNAFAKKSSENLSLHRQILSKSHFQEANWNQIRKGMPTSKDDKDKIKNDASFLPVGKDFAGIKQYPDRFEAHWSREEREGYQNSHIEAKSKKARAVETVENGSFDIVDGRPIEEGKKLAEAHTFLNKKIKGNLFDATTKKEDIKVKDATDKIIESFKGKQSNLGFESKNMVRPNYHHRETYIPRKWANKESHNKQHGSDLLQKGVFKMKPKRKAGFLNPNKGEQEKLILENNLNSAIVKMRRGRNLLMYQPTFAPFATVNIGKYKLVNKSPEGDIMKRLLQKYAVSANPEESAVTTSAVKSSTKSNPSQRGLNFLKIKAPQNVSHEKLYQSLKDIILPNIQTIFKGKQISSALISGGCPFSMMSAKIAMLYPEINLITLNALRTTKCSVDLRSLLENNFHFPENLDPDIVYQMSYSPQLFDFQIVSSNVFSWFLQMGEEFKRYMAHVLSLSKVSFIEVIDWPHLVSTTRLFGFNMMRKTTNFKEFLGSRFDLETSQIEHLKITDVSTTSWKHLKGSSIYMVEIISLNRKAYASFQDSSPKPSTFHFEKLPSFHLPKKLRMSQQFPPIGINFKLLLSLELDPIYRQRMFRSFLHLNIHKDMCPTKLYWSQGRLWHQDDNIDVHYQHRSVKELTNILNQDIHQKSFSFMDINSPNRQIGINLAQIHPNSTFILAHPSASEATKKMEEIIDLKIGNTIPLDLQITDTFTHHLLKSPEILRYQYFDFTSLLQSFHSRNLKNPITIKTTIGEILATGLTTFITVPSAKIISLAATTLYPGVFAANNTITDSAPFFENVEQILLMQSADADVKIQLHTTVHPSVSSSDDGHTFQLPWRLLSVHIMKLKFKIDHHFMIELDGHQRKYMQHVERQNASSQPIVYLFREEDEYRINYGNVNAISLIALLRMGLLPSFKDAFYDQFLQLPLYEDMAPWNIVFRSGNLEYIDQDTRDKTFDKLVPLAYQVMSVLMNYERTVKDFNHCKSPARTQYNIHFIASCVLSDFEGPCPDSRFPVPCGNNLCKSSYIECLQSLNKKMIDLKDSFEPRTKIIGKNNKDSSISNIWSFNRKGHR